MLILYRDFFFLSAADTFDNQTVWGRGLLISEKGLEKETSEGRFYSLVRTELLKRGCLRPCLESRLKEKCGFSIERVLISFLEHRTN